MEGAQFGFVVLGVGLDIDVDLRALAGGDIEFPEAEIVLVDDGLAVRGHAGEGEIGVFVVGDLDRFAAVLGDLPDVVDALHHFRAAELDALFVGQFVGDVINLAIAAVHGPEIIALVIVIAEPGEGLFRDVLEPEIHGITAAIMFAGPHAGMAGEGQFGAVRRIAGPGTPVGGERLFHAAVGRDFEKRGDAGEHALIAGGLEDDFGAVGVPVHDQIVRRVEGELARFAAFGADDVNVVISRAVGGERDPISVRRKAWIDLAGDVVGQTPDAGAIVVRDPDVPEIAEGDAAFGISGVAQQFGLGEGEGGKRQNGR